MWSLRARKQILMLEFLSICLKDFFKLKNRTTKNTEHIKAAIDWLKYAQDVTRDRGVSAWYSFGEWKASYPETTGYIIPTMFNYYHFAKDNDCRKRAIEMSDWLVSIQLNNGAFQGGTLDDPEIPMIFDTGQVLHGLIRTYNETKDNKYANAAIRAGDFLVETQDRDGAWRNFTWNNIAHAYHTRVAWSLLELFQTTGDHKYEKAARKNIKWALGNQKENGWFQNSAFSTQYDPFTHTIAYTVRGILETGFQLRDRNYIDAAIKTASALLKKFEDTGYLASSYNQNWESEDKYGCLSGDAQISMIWLRLFKITKDTPYLLAAAKLNNYLKATQNICTYNRAIRGGIKGSHPIYGEYLAFSFPNWATKFFIDALLLEETVRTTSAPFDVFQRAG